MRVPWHRRVLLDPAAVRYWVVVAVVALVLGAGVHRTLARAAATQRAWGQTRQVWVTTEPVRAGDLLERAVTSQRWPVRLVPDAAVAAVPPGARATTTLDAGAPVTAVAVHASSDGGIDERILAVPRGETTPPVGPDDLVDIWATVDPTFAPEPSLATRPVVAAARVVSVEERTVVVAVDPDEVPALTRAVSLATITLVWAR